MLLVHVGYSKTGTTFLQKRLFPHLPNANYMGRTYCEVDGSAKENLWDLVTCINGAPDVDPHQVGGRLVANMRSGLNIISQETLLLPHQTEIGAARLAYVTRGIDTRILITIRRQETMIWSRYVHDRTRTKHIIPTYDLDYALAAHGECSWPFCHKLKTQFPCKCKANKAKVIPLSFFFYDRIYNLYARHFGAENVHVLPLEYTADKPRYFSQLEKAMGAPIPQHLRASLDTSERVNKGAEVPELRRDKAKLPDLEAYKLFAISNMVLNEKLGLDLQDYGYFAPESGKAAPAPDVRAPRTPALENRVVNTLAS